VVVDEIGTLDASLRERDAGSTAIRERELGLAVVRHEDSSADETTIMTRQRTRRSDVVS
jgi:hypothetical protein